MLGPFLLTNLLIPLLMESAPARVINVSSGGMYTQRLHVEDLQSTGEKFDGPTVYARTKRAQAILTELWAKRLAGSGVVAHAMHPGWVDTPGVASSLPRFHRLTGPLLRSPDQGADTIVWLGAAAEPGESSGGFWHDRRRRPTHRVPWTRETPEDRQRLWRECERLTGRHAVPAPGSDPRAPIAEKPMAHYTASIETPRPPAETFAYLSDFSTTEQWDPGVVEAQRIGDAPVGHGTEFRLVAAFLGRKTALTYRIVEFEPREAVTLRGENATVISLDRITFEPSDGGTRVTYDADLALKGPLRIADPLLGLAFDRVGDRALEGLRKTLGSRQPPRLPRLSGRSLDGHHHHLPDDLRAQHTFIVAAFRREQQALVDEWLPWLVDLEERRPDVAVYELPVLSSAYSPARWFIDGGMARGVGTDAARARTITVYTDVAKAVRELGLAGTDTIAVLLVDRSGRILAREHGTFDDQKTMRLTAALERSSDDA